MIMIWSAVISGSKECFSLLLFNGLRKYPCVCVCVLTSSVYNSLILVPFFLLEYNVELSPSHEQAHKHTQYHHSASQLT